MASDKIRDIMSRKPIMMDGASSVASAAREMEKDGIGAVIVMEDDKLIGVVTDRDIALRCAGANRPANETPLSEICTSEVTTISPDAEIGDAVKLMESKSVRRLPVVEGDHPIGMVSLGDLAVARDPKSALGQISAAPSNN